MAKLLFGAVFVVAAFGCSPTEEPRPSRIAFAIDRAGTTSEIMLVDPKGGEPVPVAPAESTDETPAWSNDGLTLLFASNRDSQRAIRGARSVRSACFSFRIGAREVSS